tara:strand:+ start:4117 stop:4380 length:264 start_codon:yes stop_codon:yes gene_type:complete
MKGKIVRSNANISVAKVAQSVKLPLKKTTETPKKLKSLLPLKKNITKIDPASRKLSMTNVRQKNRMIEEMNDYLLKRKNVKKQNTKK